MTLDTLVAWAKIASGVAALVALGLSIWSLRRSRAASKESAEANKRSLAAQEKAATAAAQAAAAEDQSATATARAATALEQAATAKEKANEIAAEHLKLLHAQVEIDISNQIRESTHRLQDFWVANRPLLARESSTLGPNEKATRDALIVLQGSIVEEYLNAYDEACQKYIDEKVDLVRFKDKYQRQVRQIAEDKEYDEYLRTGHRFPSLMAVYDKWEDREKPKIKL